MCKVLGLIHNPAKLKKKSRASLNGKEHQEERVTAHPVPAVLQNMLVG
jgi:hypothetical protein